MQSKIPYKLIPFHTGNAIPQIGYGTYQLRGPECQVGVKLAIEAGYRHIDTASVYRNEEDIKIAIDQVYQTKLVSRSDLFITSKIGPSEQGFEETLSACDRILKKLSIDYLDLLIIHWPGAGGNKPEDKKNSELRVESWRALEKLKADGLVRDIGVSNFLKKHLVHLLENTKTIPVINQIEIHPFCYDLETIEFCKENKIVLEAYSPLARRDDILFKNEEIHKIADKHGKTIAQVALRWGLQNGFVILPKSKTEKYIKENFDIFDFELLHEEMLKIGEMNKGHHTCWNPESIEF